ncbi:hypothetical protein [Ruminococcus sp.]|uniref:hypothetical protein n=1 Tax=Ruminococcus sp. TaxID=41978 RepID=UPI00388D7476
MKNPFKRFRSKAKKTEPLPQAEAIEASAPEEAAKEEQSPGEPVAREAVPKAPADDFTEWCRSLVQGGIVPNGRNDIFEAYSVFGANSEGRLICRYYHHYPEYEKDFGLSYSRALTFDEFNKRLLAELDKGDIKLNAYHACMEKARAVSKIPEGKYPPREGFTEAETAALKQFCEAADTLTDPQFRSANGVFYCGSRSVVGDLELHLRFRKPLPFDALDAEVPGVSRKQVEIYEIDDIWILSICNRLREQCQSCNITLLTSEWSLQQEKVTLIVAEGFPGIEGTLLTVVADEAAFPRFGFYSLDFSKK